MEQNAGRPGKRSPTKADRSPLFLLSAFHFRSFFPHCFHLSKTSYSSLRVYDAVS